MKLPINFPMPIAEEITILQRSNSEFHRVKTQALHSKISPERAEQIGELAAAGAIDAFAENIKN